MLLNWDNSKVTVELRELVESGIKPWDFSYPSYYKGDEKTAFEQKVLDHFWFRQIGQETPARWLHYFRTRIREIMPYYIQLYESQALMQAIEDPFGNVDVTETFEETRTGTRSDTASRDTSSEMNTTRSDSGSVENEDGETLTESGTTENTKRFSNTPQGSISNLDSYLTEATIDDGSSSGTHTKEGSSSSTSTSSGTQKDTASGSVTDESESSESGTVKHTLTRKGNQGVNTYAHDMKELRETFLNIDMQIINDLNDLFLMVY